MTIEGSFLNQAVYARDAVLQNEEWAKASSSSSLCWHRRTISKCTDGPVGGRPHSITFWPSVRGPCWGSLQRAKTSPGTWLEKFIARGFLSPRADEPSGSLDSKNKEELHKLLFDLRDKFGLTIVIVTHDKELAALSDRVIQMRDGQIIN